VTGGPIRMVFGDRAGRGHGSDGAGGTSRAWVHVSSVRTTRLPSLDATSMIQGGSSSGPSWRSGWPQSLRPGAELRALGDMRLALVCQGQVDEGFALLDEVMVGISAGEIPDPATPRVTLCALMSACDRRLRRGGDCLRERKA
jgi:hypothetical protein